MPYADQTLEELKALLSQRNLDASTLTKDEVIQLLEKTDAISAQSDAPKVEQSEASEDPSSSAVVAATDAQDTTSSSVVAPPPAEHVDPTSGEPIRTLYVGSCPPSLSERELYQVFNRFVGYESSYLYHSNGKLANQNSNRKRRADQYYPAEVGYAYAAARPVSAPLDNYGYGSGSSYYGGYPTAAASSGIPGYENYTQVADLASAAYTSGKSSSRMPPSATLFISYITDETSVDDLRAVFGQMVGFRAARKTTMRGAPCAFIEFDNDRNSTIAMNIMQGQCLRPTDRGGLRIEYAKPTLNPTKTAASVPLPVNNGAYVGAYAGSSGRW